MARKPDVYRAFAGFYLIFVMIFFMIMAVFWLFFTGKEGDFADKCYSAKKKHCRKFKNKIYCQ